MRKLALVVLTGFLIPGLAHALGLGEIKVDSALNQPLKAEITVLSANPDEVIDIVAQLADQEAFDRLGLERPYVLTKLQFKPAVREGVPVIVVTTRKPVKEPFLDFLLDVRWPKGRLLREYTVLLDPPVLMESQAVATQAPEVPAAEPQPEVVVAPAPVVSVEPEPVAVAEPAPEPVVAAEPEPAPEPVAVVEPEPAPAPEVTPEPVAVAPAAEPVIRPDTGMAEEPEMAAAPLFPLIPIGVDDAASFYGEEPSGDYTVEANDTLWEIANENRPEDVTVNQMMMAMLRANPDAFYQNNINNLKKGVILRMPTREELDAVDTAAANTEVKEQYALWREYREQVAGETTQQYVLPAVAEGESAIETASAETSEAAETEVAADEGELKILAPESEPATGETVLAGGDDLSTLQNDLNLAKESLESSRQKNEDLESRVQELEQMLKKQERLINLKDEQISDLQSQMQTAPSVEEAVEQPVIEEAPAPEEMPQSEAVEEPAVTEVAEETVTEEVITEEVQVAEGEMPAAVDEVVEEAVAEAGVSEELAPVEEQPAEEVEIAVVEEAAPEPAAEPLEPEVAKAPEPEKAAPSFLDDLLADPKMLGIAGGGILLVIALIISLVRRMGKTKEAAPVPVEPAPDFAAAEEVKEEVPEIEETQVMEQPVFEEEAPAEEPATEREPFSGESTQVMDVEGEEGAVAEEAVLAGDEAAEADDTLSEADVYLAYGLHDQCEELLNKALEENPGRNDYRAKALENYFASKDKAKFESMAQELHDKLGDTSSPLWARTVVMGKELAPENDLFSGDVADVSLADIVTEKPEADEFDLSVDLGAGDEAPDLEIGSVDLDMDEGLDITEAAAEPTEELDITAEVAVEESADEGLEFDVGDIDLGDIDLGEGDDELLTIDEGTETETLDLGEELESDSGTLTMDQPPSIPEEDLSADLTLETDIPVSFEVGEPEPEVDETSDTGTLDVGELEVSEADLDEETVNLDVDFGAAEEPSAEVDLGLDEGLGLDEEIGLPDSEDEVGTKLDLAKAYIDMGDNDGARSTLEEVMNEGNDDQKKEAQDLMGQIS